jgi:hypothetical protein
LRIFFVSSYTLPVVMVLKYYSVMYSSNCYCTMLRVSRSMTSPELHTVRARPDVFFQSCTNTT